MFHGNWIKNTDKAGKVSHANVLGEIERQSV